MDYETIVYGGNCQNYSQCYLNCQELSWERGEVTEISLPIFGGFTLEDGNFISIVDFIKGSSTKSIKLVLKDHYGEEVNSQEILANSPDIVYDEDHITCYFSVDSNLSELLTPGSYSLYVYLQEVLPGIGEKYPETTVFNKMVTRPEGLEIIIY